MYATQHLFTDCPAVVCLLLRVQLSERGQTYLIYALRIVGFCVGGVTTALGVYVLASKRDTDVRDIVLDLYRIVFGTLAAAHLSPSLQLAAQSTALTKAQSRPPLTH